MEIMRREICGVTIILRRVVLRRSFVKQRGFVWRRLIVLFVMSALRCVIARVCVPFV